jgi:2-amino-4-hydroxy-6-hydroxymethyldihydropteridine diphosphokinase
MEYTAYIGLGSNVESAAGSPAETVRAAVEALGELGSVAAQSSLYRTAPVGFKEQPDFVNAVVCLETRLRPEELLRETLAIERSFGRDRQASVSKGPRTLDLDLLLVFEEGGAAVVCDSAMLTLPHPEMANRRFVLEPLEEIAPGLRHPMLHKTIRGLMEELANGGGDIRDEVLRIQD